MKFRITALCAALMAIVAVPSATRAGVGLDVNPAKVDMSIGPGGTFNLPLMIKNEQPDSVHVQASEFDFELNKTGDYQFGKAGSQAFSIMKWVSINPREFDIPPGTTQQVRLTVSIPKTETLSGEYAGIVFFQTRPDRKRGAISFSARVGTKLYNTIPGTVKPGGEIEKFNVAVSNSGQLYRIAFKNTGNAHAYINGRIEVRRGSNTVDKVTLPKSELVERGGQRLIEVSGKKLEAGSYDAVAIIDYGGSSLTGGQVRFEAR